MLIDIGASSKDEAESVCCVGDAVCFAETAASLGNECFMAKALDDRAGCAILLKLALTQPEYDVTLAFTVREEIGHGGANTAAFIVKPDIAVAIDATTASDIMEVPTAKQVCRQGAGGVISFMDRATMYDKALYDEIFRLATERGIAVQSKRMVSGGNDAAALQTAGEGARVAAVSLPCRYIHSPLCMLDDSDVRETYRLLEAMMNTLPVWDGAL
jgi:endoglucanase